MTTAGWPKRGIVFGVAIVCLSWLQGFGGDLRHPTGLSGARDDDGYGPTLSFDAFGWASAPAEPAPSGSARSSPAPAAEPGTPQGACGNGCGEANGCDEDEGCAEKNKCRWCHCGELGDPWTLPQPCCLKHLGINVSGWMQGGLYTNAHGAPNNGPLGFNNLTNFNLHQLWLYAERKTDAETHGWDLGGRVDYVFGVDGPDTQAFGDQSWDFGWNSSRDYGSAIPQLYAELAFGNWTIKGGRFYTPHGYEVVPATGNFFYSHSYMMFYAEPFTHTGFVATYKFCDHLSAFGGWVDGWDSGWANRNGADLFLGGVNLTLSDRASVAWSFTAGNWGTGAIGNAGDIFFHSLLFTYKLNDKWTYVFQHDLASNTGVVPGGTEWYGIAQYLIYQINDCWSAGGRIEWFRDDDGVRVAPPGKPGSYYEATLGLNYKPHANLLVRPEIRWDWFDGTPGGARPYNNGLADSQFSGGFDVIFTF